MSGLFFSAIFAATLAACAPVDPLLDSQRAALGPESAAVPVGPRHRPGQACVLCHEDGGNAPVFSVAGTVYRDNLNPVPLADVTVTLTDAQKRTFVAHTNCAGNFFVTPSQFVPAEPFFVSLGMGENTINMESPIHRQLSCAGCHGDPATPARAGHVYLTADDLVANTITPRPCRADE